MFPLNLMVDDLSDSLHVPTFKKVTSISILALQEFLSNYWILGGYWSWHLHHLHTSSND